MCKIIYSSVCLILFTICLHSTLIQARTKSLDPDDKGEYDAKPEGGEDGNGLVMVTIPPGVLEEAPLPEDKPLPTLPEPRMEIYDSEDRAQPTYFMRPPKAFEAPKETPTEESSQSIETEINHKEEINAREPEKKASSPSAGKDEAKKALLASLSSEMMKSSPNEAESEDKEPAEDSASPEVASEAKQKSGAKSDSNEDGAKKEMMKNMFNEIMKQMKGRAPMGEPYAFPVSKEEKERADFEQMMLMMKSGGMPSMSPSAMFGGYGQPSYGINPLMMNSAAGAGSNPMMNQMLMMQLMRQQQQQQQNPMGMSNQMMGASPGMMMGMPQGAMGMNQGMGMNPMGMNQGMGMSPMGAMGMNQGMTGMNPMMMQGMRRAFPGNPMGAMGVSPYQQQQQHMVQMVPQPGYHGQQLVPGQEQIPPGQEQVPPGQEQPPPLQEQIVGQEQSGHQNLAPNEPQSQSTAQEINPDQGTNPGSVVGAGASKNTRGPMEGSDGDVSLERRIEKMKQQSAQSDLGSGGGQTESQQQQSGQESSEQEQNPGSYSSSGQVSEFEQQLYEQKEREVSSIVETTPVPSLEESDFLEQLLKANGESSGYGVRRRAKRYRRPKYLVKASIRKLSPDRLEKAKWLKEPSPEFCHETILIHDECDSARASYGRRSKRSQGERRWSFSLEDGTCLLYNDPCPQLKRNSFTQLSQCIATCWRQFDNGPEAYYK